MQQEIDTYISEGEAVYNVQLLVSLSLIFIPVFSFHVHIVMLHIVFLHATCRYKCSPLVELNLCLKSIKNSTSWKVKCSVVKARNGQPVLRDIVKWRRVEFIDVNIELKIIIHRKTWCQLLMVWLGKWNDYFGHLVNICCLLDPFIGIGEGEVSYKLFM